MNTLAQCWKQNAPQTGGSEGRLLLWQELQLSVGEVGTGPPGRRWDDHAPSHTRAVARATIISPASMRNHVLGKLTAKTALRCGANLREGRPALMPPI